MPVLLHIEASPNGAESASGAVARHLAERYVAHRPKWTVETVALWAVALPEFDPAAAAARGSLMAPPPAAEPVRRGQSAPPPPPASQAWQETLGIAAHFASADALLFSVPMWNLGVPYRLKHYMDLVLQPGIAFAEEPDAKGRRPGLLAGKPAFAVFSRGGTWTPKLGDPLEEHQASWLRQVLRMIGCTPIREIVVEPTSASPKMKAHTLAGAMRRAEEIAAEHHK